MSLNVKLNVTLNRATNENITVEIYGNKIETKYELFVTNFNIHVVYDGNNWYSGIKLGNIIKVLPIEKSQSIELYNAYVLQQKNAYI